MPQFVVDKIQNALNDRDKPLRDSHVHVLGVAYKRDIDDMRESPAVDIIHLLLRRGCDITFSDPYVPAITVAGQTLHSQDPVEQLRKADAVAILTDHTCFDYPRVALEAQLVVDTRNSLKTFHSPNIVRL